MHLQLGSQNLPEETEENTEKSVLLFSFWKNRFWIIVGSVNYCVVQELCPDGVVTCLHFQLLQTKVPKVSSGILVTKQSSHWQIL